MASPSESLKEKLARLKMEKGALAVTTETKEKEEEIESPIANETISSNKTPAKGEAQSETMAEKLARLRGLNNKTNAVSSSTSPYSTKQLPVPSPKQSLSLKDMGSAIRVAPELPEAMAHEAPSVVYALRERIWKLQEESLGGNLKDEIFKLRDALLENPSAVSYFLPEDYGEMVRHIRALTGNSVAAALAKPARASRGAAAKANKSVEALSVSLDDLSF